MASDNTIHVCKKGWPPSLFIIGAQKAGTTFLADALGQHPEVQLSDPKEPGFLAGKSHRGLAWYERCFSGVTDRVLIDASTSYSMAPLSWCKDSDPHGPLAGVPERIKELSPDAKLIYVIRQPSQRTYSAYWHNVRAGRESNQFRDALQKTSLYLRTSDYMSQLEEYLSVFAVDKIKVVIFEDLVRKPLDEMNACCKFIGIDNKFEPNISQKNKSYVYRGNLQNLNMRFSRKGGITPLVKNVAQFVPDRIKKTMAKAVVEAIPPMSAEDKAYLDHYFQPMIEHLEKFIGRKIDAWIRPQ